MTCIIPELLMHTSARFSGTHCGHDNSMNPYFDLPSTLWIVTFSTRTKSELMPRCDFLTIGCIFRKRSKAELSSFIEFSCSVILSSMSDQFIVRVSILSCNAKRISFIIIDSVGCFLLSTCSCSKCDGSTLSNCSLYLNWVQLLRFFSAFSH
jgi:hypothetical protein